MTALPSREEIVHRFRLAAAHDDVDAIRALVDPNVVALTDSAGDVIATTIPLHGSDRAIPEAIANLSLRSGTVVTEQVVNAAPALVVHEGSRVIAIVSFGLDAGLITHVWIIRSPQKLQRWNTSA